MYKGRAPSPLLRRRGADSPPYDTMKTAEKGIGEATEEVKRFYVYELRDDTGKVFYVGKGKGKRASQHRAAAIKGVQLRVYHKIRKLWREGRDFEVVKVFFTSDEEKAHTEEIRLIAHYGRANLSNLTDGGEGLSGYRLTRQACARRSASHLGKVVAASVGVSISKTKLGDRALSDGDVEKMKNLRSEGKTWREIGAAFNVSKSTARRRIGKPDKSRPAGLVNIQPYRKLTAEIVLEIRQRYSQGDTITNMALDYLVSITTMHSVVHFNSWRNVEGPHDDACRRIVVKTGAKEGTNPTAKLTAREVYEMRVLHRSGETSTNIAEAYGVSIGAACFAIKGITWSNVPFPEKTEADERIAKKRKFGRFTLSEEDVVAIRALYAEGYGSIKIAKIHGLTPQKVVRAVKGECWSHIPGSLEMRPNGVVLSDSDVLAIRLGHFQGKGYPTLARMFNTSTTRIRKIVSGELFPDAPFPENYKVRRYKPLDDDLVLKMRWMVGQGRSQASVTRELGVEASVGRRAIVGTTHSHLPLKVCDEP